jgi:hypothetical protein
MIKKLGFIAQCSKIDVKSAFRLLPMYQGEFDFPRYCGIIQN